MPEPSFRLAKTSDIDMMIQMMGEFYHVDHMIFDEAIARRALTKLLGDESLGRAWLIQHNDQVVGYVVITFCFSLEFDGTAAVVDELYVKEDHRGRGIGTRTLQFLESVCRSLGIRTLHLEVDRSNSAAQSVYRKAGFEDRNNFYLSKWVS